jgi:DNA polymerase
MNCFLPDLQISKVHGQPKRYKGQVYLPLFHPAAALYNGAMRQTVIDDFCKIPTIIDMIQTANTITN